MGAAGARCCNLENAQAFGSTPIPRVHVENRPDGFEVGEFVAENRGRIDQFYDVYRDHSIGEGSFAFVYECRNKVTGQKRAVKAINRKNLRSNSKYENEIMMHRMTDYPGIVRIVESFEDSKNIFLVLELCSGGELFDYIIDKGPFPEPLAGTLLRQMLRTAGYLHGAHLTHRDMKAENWLFHKKVPLEKLEQVKLKLVDFGLARELPPGVHARTKAGSPYYVAPEVLQGKYGHRVDIWTVGVVFYMMLSGVAPFTGTRTEEVLNAVRTQKPPSHKLPKSLTPEACEMMNLLLTRDAHRRPEAAVALQHRFLIGEVDPKGKRKGERKMAPWQKVPQGKMNFSMEHMQHYASLTRLEKVALSAIGTQLGSEETAEFEKLFVALDADCDGVLSSSEFADGLLGRGMVLEKRQFYETVFVPMDLDFSGGLDYSEFVAMAMEYETYTTYEPCWRAFKVFDVNDVGIIEHAELVAVLKAKAMDLEHSGAGTIEVEEAFKLADCNGDGKIDFEDFWELVKRIKPGSESGKGNFKESRGRPPAGPEMLHHIA